MIDSQVMSIVQNVDPAGEGPDSPLFSEAAMSRLASLPSSEKALLDLVHQADAAEDVRFVAAEALLEGQWTGWKEDAAHRRSVADVLAKYMAHDRIHNRWGLPGSFVGPYGRRLLSLGNEAEAALNPLLGDASLLNIVGSEAATLNSQAGFRVSDLAAYLISQIPRRD